MTGCKSLLKDFHATDGPPVIFGDNGKGSTEGYGFITNGAVKIMKVGYVNGLKHNLISISQLCDAKFSVNFNEFRGTVTDRNGKIVLVAPRNKNLYRVDMNASNQEVCLYSNQAEELNWLWHKRLSHLNFKNISKLSRGQLVNGLPQIKYEKEKLCASCEMGKQHKSSFKSKLYSSIKSCFDLLHMDLFGPINVQSISGKNYTLVIVDEFSRYAWYSS